MSAFTPHVALPLPLTAEPTEAGAVRVTGVTPEMIRGIVNDFYMACRCDPTLGPIFARQISDWDAHLERIRNFWGAAMLGTGEYSGRPMEVHNSIPRLTAEHFSIWLRLFRRTVERWCTPEDATVIMTMAGRMARNIMATCPMMQRGEGRA